MPDLDCPRCHGTMEPGVIIDRTYGANVQPEWAEGDPEVSHWFGLKLKGKERHAVRTFRCARCGYLESYAN